jgi:hypothetical protein
VRSGLDSVARNLTNRTNFVDLLRFKCSLHDFEVGDVLILVLCIHLHTHHRNIAYKREIILAELKPFSQTRR